MKERNDILTILYTCKLVSFQSIVESSRSSKFCSTEYIQLFKRSALLALYTVTFVQKLIFVIVHWNKSINNIIRKSKIENIR